MATGARPGQVLGFVFRRLGALIAAGAFVGLLGGAAASKLLAVIVYQADARDPWVIFGPVCSITTVAFAAAYGPARRALRLNPVSSLRHG